MTTSRICVGGMNQRYKDARIALIQGGFFISGHVPQCPTMSRNVPQCPAMSHDVPLRDKLSHQKTKCPIMSHGKCAIVRLEENDKPHETREANKLFGFFHGLKKMEGNVWDTAL